MLRKESLGRLVLAFLVLLFLIGGTIGCALDPGIKITGEDSEAFAKYKAAYIAASEEFEKTWEKYLNTWEVMPPEIQKRWAEEIDPLFLDAADALDKWEAHVLSGTFVPTSMEDYRKIKDQLFLMLIREKIKEQQAQEAQ